MAKDVGVKTAIAGIASEYVEFLPLGILPRTISGQFIKIEVTEIRDTLAQNETLTSGVERRPIQRRILPSRGPYAADTFMGSANYKHFDGVLAMYYDQGIVPFMTLATGEGVRFTAGLPIVHTAPVHGTAYDIAGKGIASEDSFRQAIYVALDVFRRRQTEEEISARPLRKQYYEKRDDSDKLKLDTVEED